MTRKYKTYQTTSDSLIRFLTKYNELVNAGKILHINMDDLTDYAIIDRPEYIRGVVVEMFYDRMKELINSSFNIEEHDFDIEED